MRRGIGTVLGRRAFQLYAFVLAGLVVYLHFIHSRSGEATDYISARSTAIDLYSGAHLQKQHDEGGYGDHHGTFILSLNYWEQFTMATANLLGLICLGSKWNATTVQPFTFNSRLYGLRDFKPGIMGVMLWWIDHVTQYREIELEVDEVPPSFVIDVPFVYIGTLFTHSLVV